MSARPLRRGLLVVMALILAAVVSAPGAAAGEQLTVDAVDASRAPTVSVTVTPPATTGADTVLDGDDVRVEEAGQARAARVTRLPGEGLAVAVVLDTSGSMQGAPLAAAQAAAATFVDRLPADARIAVVAFGSGPVLVAPLQTDRAALKAAVHGLAAGGETALYDAVGLALDQLGGDTGTRRHVVVLSDGGDTASTTSLDAAAARIAASGVRLDVAELVTTGTNHDALVRLAQAGHGTVVPTADANALNGIYDRLGRSLASQYRIEFEAQGHGPTPVRLVVSAGGATAEASFTVDLPAAAAVTSTPATSPPATAPPATAPESGGAERGSTGHGWALVVGAALCFAAILILASPLARSDSAHRLAAYARPGAPAASALSRLTERATAVTEGALERHGKRGRLNEALERAGIALRPGEFVVLAGSVAVAALAVGTLLGGLVWGLLLAAAAAAGARVVVEVLAGRRRRRFSEQLGDNLQLMAGTLRSGYGVMQAIDAVAQEAESPARDEFRRIVVESRLGRDLTESLRMAGRRVGGEDFEWVAQAIEINREVGGDLAEVLDNVGATIRERDRVKRQVKAVSAEGRLSAYVLVALPLGLAGILAAINPDYFAELTRGAGLALSAVGLVMLAIGSFWLSRMVKVDY